MNNIDLRLSIIVPVYNRTKEIEELLESLNNQTNKNFEIIIVEDGSSQRCDLVVENNKDKFNIKYFYKENTGPGQSRNFGCEKAEGNYFIILDSDCILPSQYIEVVLNFLNTNFADAFGGPDSAHEGFTNLQKSINYAMTSFFTTGGIRGGGEKFDKFYPRSFNMGFSKEVFNKTGGFPCVQFANTKAAGEDIELSIQIRKLGFSIKLIKEAFVYHKRRTNIKQFFRQTYNFGFARVSLFIRNQGALKIVHVFPSLFLLGMFLLIVLSILFSVYFIIPIIIFSLLLFVDSSIKNKNIYIGILATLASYIQFIGYGSGFIIAFCKLFFFGKR